MLEIKKSLYLPVIFLLAHFSSAQTDFKLSKDHDALLVKDLEVASDFYVNILGLEEISNGGLPDHIRWFQLNDRVQIHLKESEDEIQHEKAVHYALNTPKLKELMVFLKRKNIRFENRDGHKNTTNDRPDGIKQIYIQDPDGYWIEINNGEL